MCLVHGKKEEKERVEHYITIKIESDFGKAFLFTIVFMLLRFATLPIKPKD